MRLAAIDIGSNSIKVTVAEASGDVNNSDSFKIVERVKETVRLGSNTLRQHFLQPDAIARAADCINRFCEVAANHRADKIVAVATASVREAKNAAEFIRTVEDRTGVRVEVLSGIEEARLIGLAAMGGCGASSDALVNIDIGGGSTEISVISADGNPSHLFSMQIGAVGLTERFAQSDPIKGKELRQMRSEIRAALERPVRELQVAKWSIATGTSGTIIALGATLEEQSGKRSAASNLIKAENSEKSSAIETVTSKISLKRLEKLNEQFAAQTVAERVLLPTISRQRAEIVVAGGQILEGVMRALKIEELRPCQWALREGVIIDRLRELAATARPPVPDEVDPRLAGVHQLGMRFNYEDAHAHVVALFAERVFDQLAARYKMTREERTLLSAASLLHDIGYAIAHESHHKHSHYIIKNSELTGFAEAERLLIANIARYHRRAFPKERHPDYAVLSESERVTVKRLAAILRLAEAFERSHDTRVQDIRVTHESESNMRTNGNGDGHAEASVVRMQISSGQNCEQEIWAAEQSAQMFEQAFDCRLIFSQLEQPSASGR